MSSSPFIIDIDENARITYMNQKTGEKWSEWKLIKDCSEKETAQANLATPHPKYIVLDKDFGDTVPDIAQEFEILKNKLFKLNIINWVADRSRNGFHIFIPTTNLEFIEDKEVQNEIRAIFINQLGCDISKKSVQTVISLPNRPHFKTNIVHGLLGVSDGPIYTLTDGLINVAKSRVAEKQKIIKKLEIDADFKNYFKEDKFWKYISNNIIPDNTSRDFTIFPNLAIAAIKSGKNTEEIKEIINPIIQKNFPGKTWAEFAGWLRKAALGEIETYNFYQLNTWMKTYSDKKEEIYNMNISLQEDLIDKINNNETDKDLTTEETKNKYKFYWDDELDQIANQKTEWLVEGWIPKGDMSFIAGKAASFKSTIALHMGYAIATGKLVFNKYKTKKCKVLYINEENSSNIMVSMIKRVKKGLGLDDVNLRKDFGISILENIKMDDTDDLYFLIEFIKKHEIEVLFCDSFTRFIRFDENNATEMNKMFNNWKTFRKACNNLTIITLHHHKKSNSQYSSDSRDMLRGSSDIVNNADSIIAVDRKKGSKYIKISHIKNRSGEEMENKLIIMDSGENKDMAYFYESDKELDKAGAVALPDKCAEDIFTWLEKDKKYNFSKKEIPQEIVEKYSPDVLSRSLREMVSEGTLGRIGKGPSSQYTFTQLKEKEKQDELD